MIQTRQPLILEPSSAASKYISCPSSWDTYPSPCSFKTVGQIESFKILDTHYHYFSYGDPNDLNEETRQDGDESREKEDLFR